MNCQEASLLLPLGVEGDLPAREQADLQAHVDGCPTCQEALQALQRSQDWLRAAPPAPFSEADRALFRQEVMARIRAERPARGLRVRTLLAAAAVLLLALAPLLRRRPAPPAPAPPQARVAPPVPQPAEVPPVLRHVRRPAPLPAPSETPLAVARMELQTPNPQIRIIWLARATPAPQPLQEAP